MHSEEHEELDRVDAVLGAGLAGLAPSPGFERGVLERIDALAARRAWVRAVILDGVGSIGLALAAFTALDYLLSQPGVESALPQLAAYAPWAAAGLGCLYLAWASWRGKPGASPY